MRKENENKCVRAVELKKQGIKRKDIAEKLGVDVSTITIWTKQIPRYSKLKSRKEKLETRKEWYKKNKSKSIGWVKKRENRIKKWWKNYKSSLSCEKCSEEHISCIDFHHINPEEKEINLGNAIGSGWSKERILKEVSKCVVVCANCHRKLHYDLRHN